MKATTQVHAAFRNVGDSQDTGSFYCGPLKETILWLTTQLGGCSMATRIVIGIGRNEDDARKAIQVPKAGAQKVTEDMSRLLDELLADTDTDDDSSAEGANALGDSQTNNSRQATSRLPGDDYQM